MLTDPLVIVRGHLYAAVSSLIASTIICGVVDMWRIDAAYADETSPMAAMRQFEDPRAKEKKLGEEMIKSLKNELKQAEKMYGKNSPQARDLYVAIGNSHVLKMDFIGLANNLKKALKIQESITGKESVETIDYLVSIHHAYAMTGLSGEGKKYLKKAEKIAFAHPGIAPKQKSSLLMAREISDVFQGKKNVGEAVDAIVGKSKGLTNDQSETPKEPQEPLKPIARPMSNIDEQKSDENGSAAKRRALLDMDDIYPAEDKVLPVAAVGSSLHQRYMPVSVREYGEYDVDLKYDSIKESYREQLQNEPS